MNIRRKRPPTMSDVARLAGVNRVTASVALSGARASTKISEATRQRILEAARQLGYVPNARALAFRNQRTHIIGYVGVSYLSPYDSFSAAVLTGLQRACNTYKYDLLLYGGFERENENDLYDSVASGKVDGLICLPVPGTAFAERLANAHVPIVTIANTLPGLPAVTVDDFRGARLLAEYLAAKGHRRVLYHNAPDPFTSTMRRYRAFEAAAAQHGMQVTAFTQTAWPSTLTPEEVALLTAPPSKRATAVAIWADHPALDLIPHFLELGLRVPEDLAVVGFNGIALLAPPRYRLTTVRAPWEEVAATAVGHLNDVIEGREVPLETMLPVELVVGDTA
jgi:DNA-binding LacI/PurR family transcriptional regulator